MVDTVQSPFQQGRFTLAQITYLSLRIEEALNSLRVV